MLLKKTLAKRRLTEIAQLNESFVEELTCPDEIFLGYLTFFKLRKLVMTVAFVSSVTE